MLSATVSILVSYQQFCTLTVKDLWWKGNQRDTMNIWKATFLFATGLLAQPPQVRLPDESTEIDGITRTLISVFDQADIIALGETHQWRLDTDLRIALVR